MVIRITCPLCSFLILAVAAGNLPRAAADPCGMVPPVYPGQGPAIVRVGEQRTYVFYADGIETFVIRPGFDGKVDQFGMLIPFPEPPAIRKVSDDIFAHIAAAIDPPEIIVDLRIRAFGGFGSGGFGGGGGGGFGGAPLMIAKDEVRVVREEAVGMYEVAVLEAGSAAALKRWMDDHDYVYPKGMGKACEEYVADGWCFVAVKTKVGTRQGVDPKPGQRKVDDGLPADATFDGHVQAMGFRFRTPELVVPMRLSTFNEGELENIVYLLTSEPSKIRRIPEEYVVRQVSGQQLYHNLTRPLPVRILGGTEKDIPIDRRKLLVAERNPVPHNGHARELFAADLHAVRSGKLSLEKEEEEKELLRIGERLGLRGSKIDKLHADTLARQQTAEMANALRRIKSMTMTVVAGDFPREALAEENLRFAAYTMPARRNSPASYDAKLNGPAPKQEGVLKLGALFEDDRAGSETGQLSADGSHRGGTEPATDDRWFWILPAAAMAGFLLMRRVGWPSRLTAG